MNNTEKEVVPGLTSNDVREIADKIFKKTDGNHPQSSRSESGFINILKNGKPDISASSVFIRKVSV